MKPDPRLVAKLAALKRLADARRRGDPMAVAKAQAEVDRLTRGLPVMPVKGGEKR